MIEEKQVATCEQGVQDYSQGGELHEDQESEADVHYWDVRDSAYYMVVYGFSHCRLRNLFGSFLLLFFLNNSEKDKNEEEEERLLWLVFI